MKKIFFIVLIFSTNVNAQYNKYIDSLRSVYKKEFLEDPRSPVKVTDTTYLQFYKANTSYKVKAIFTASTDTTEWDMQTHSGKIKKYFTFGTLHFNLKNKPYILHIYKSKMLKLQEQYKDLLFIPFTDYTNNITTFGGGRYLDIREGQIINNVLELDFNLCYNPYCAFGEGFNCPIPPAENNLKTKILAGEKLWIKK